MGLRHKTISHSLVFSSLLLLVSSAHAQSTASTAEGFAINRFNPSERGSEWFAAESLDMRGHLRPSIGLTLDWAHKPLVIYAPDSTERTVLIENQVFAHIGASLVLWDRLRLGASMPLALTQSGESGAADGFIVASPEGGGLGDLRLGADVRLYGAYSDPLTFALGAQVFAPTGSREKFTGDEAIRVLPRALAAGSYGMFTYAATLGVQYRSLDEGFVGKKTGTEVVGSVSAGVRLLDGSLVLGPELFGSAVVASSLEASKPTKAPVELVLGGHYTVGPMRLGAGVGPGLTRGIGEPTLRVLGSAEYVASADIDTDGDKILDKVDACVTVPGVPHKEPKKHGCPSDRDGDKIYDRDDACVSVPGVAQPDPKKHGCPLDRDSDGIYDAIDACPDIPGLPSEDKRLHGCQVDQDKSALTPLDRDRDRVRDDVDQCVDVPGLKEAPSYLSAAQKQEWEKKYLGCPEDLDGDKIPNIPDACPRDPGPAHKEPARHGCPLAIVQSCEIKIMDRVYFKTQSDKLETTGAKGLVTQAVLQAVADILRSNSKITRIEVQGHASQDAYPRNQELSDKRAASVVRWLVEHGVEVARITPKGYGTSKPAQGVPVEKAYKELHQRVEFHILEPKCDGASSK